MHSIAPFHSVDSANFHFNRHLPLLLPRPKQIAELVLVFCVFVWTALPMLQLAFVVQTTLPAASPEQLEALIAKPSSGGRAGAVSVPCFICAGIQTQMCLCCSLGLLSEQIHLAFPLPPHPLFPPSPTSTFRVQVLHPNDRCPLPLKVP